MLRGVLDVSIMVYDNDHREMDNDKIYRLRKDLSDVMREYGLGIPEERDGKFVFQRAPPVEDEYYTPENVLCMSFSFDFWGVLFIAYGIESYTDHVRQHYENTNALARFTYHHP